MFQPRLARDGADADASPFMKGPVRYEGNVPVPAKAHRGGSHSTATGLNDEPPAYENDLSKVDPKFRDHVRELNKYRYLLAKNTGLSSGTGHYEGDVSKEDQAKIKKFDGRAQKYRDAVGDLEIGLRLLDAPKELLKQHGEEHNNRLVHTYFMDREQKKNGLGLSMQFPQNQKHRDQWARKNFEWHDPNHPDYDDYLREVLPRHDPNHPDYAQWYDEYTQLYARQSSGSRSRGTSSLQKSMAETMTSRSRTQSTDTYRTHVSKSRVSTEAGRKELPGVKITSKKPTSNIARPGAADNTKKTDYSQRIKHLKQIAEDRVYSPDRYSAASSQDVLIAHKREDYHQLQEEDSVHSPDRHRAASSQDDFLAQKWAVSYQLQGVDSPQTQDEIPRGHPHYDPSQYHYENMYHSDIHYPSQSYHAIPQYGHVEHPQYAYLHDPHSQYYPHQANPELLDWVDHHSTLSVDHQHYGKPVQLEERNDGPVKAADVEAVNGWFKAYNFDHGKR